MRDPISELQMIRAWAMAATTSAKAKSRRDERGAADLATIVIITAILAAAAIAIAAIIVTKLTAKANSIPTG